MLNDDALLAGRPVPLQGLDLHGVGPQQLGRPVHQAVVDLETGLIQRGAAQQLTARRS